MKSKFSKIILNLSTKKKTIIFILYDQKMISGYNSGIYYGNHQQFDTYIHMCNIIIIMNRYLS